MKTYSAKQTQAIAARFAKTLHGGEVIALQGELGSGKTTFVQGLARALGVRHTVKSPTFVLMQNYQLPATSSKIKFLCHVDAYRLDPQADPRDLGLEDYLGKPGTVTVIEWPERIKEILPKKMVWIRFAHTSKENERKIAVIK